MWPFKREKEKIEDEKLGCWFGRPVYTSRSIEHPYWFGGGWSTPQDYEFLLAKCKEYDMEYLRDNSGPILFDKNGCINLVAEFGIPVSKVQENFEGLSKYIQTGKGLMTEDEARQMFLRDYKSADEVLQKEKEVWKKYGRNMIETLSVICEYCGSRFETGQGWNCPKCGAPIKG